MKAACLILASALFILALLFLCSCAPQPMTPQQSRLLNTTADTALGGALGYATGGSAGALLGATAAFSRDLKAAKKSGKQPRNVHP
jgi:hypothetical protein